MGGLPGRWESGKFPLDSREFPGVLRSPQESTRNAWGKVKTSVRLVSLGVDHYQYMIVQEE
jgi:hypothetical protein